VSDGRAGAGSQERPKEFTRAARVLSATGEEVGRIDRVVLDARTHQPTHVVVRQGRLLTEDKVVPIGWVARTGEDEVRLEPPAGDLSELPPFEETHFVPADGASSAGPDSVSPYYWYPPVIGFQPPGLAGLAGAGYPLPGFTAETERNVPAGSLALKEGAPVLSLDDQSIGTIAEIVVGGEGQPASHLIVVSGGPKPKRRLIPTHWITRVEGDNVHLAVNARLLEGLDDRA
jgi:uncharacterized protein YrrD